VNNAGRSQRAFVVDTEIAVDREMIELNIIAPVSLTKCVVPHMIARRRGHVAVTSSIAGKIGNYYYYYYVIEESWYFYSAVLPPPFCRLFSV